MSRSDLLAGLRDVHEPLPPETALPWLLLANLLVALSIVSLLLYRHWRARRAWRNDALKQIRIARDLSPDKARASLAMTLRRVMLLLDGPVINSLSGKPWLHRLDNRFATNFFSDGDGRLFGESLYAPCTLGPNELDTLCKQLSKHVESLPSNAPSKGPSLSETPPGSSASSAIRSPSAP